MPATFHTISIVGKKGTDPTLDAEGSGTVLTVELGGSVVVKHLTITNGYNLDDRNGGAILNLGNMRLKKCTISNSSSISQEYYASLYAGGNYNNNVMSIEDCLVRGNVADRGGGIYNAGTMTIIGISILENSLSSVPMYCYGGGVYNDYGDMVITNSSIHDNVAFEGSGAGVVNSWNLIIRDSSIAKNSAVYGSGGGGLYNSALSQFVVKDSKIKKNVPDNIVSSL